MQEFELPKLHLGLVLSQISQTGRSNLLGVKQYQIGLDYYVMKILHNLAPFFGLNQFDQFLGQT